MKKYLIALKILIENRRELFNGLKIYLKSVKNISGYEKKFTIDLPGLILKKYSEIEFEQTKIQAYERETGILAKSKNDKLNLGCGYYPMSGWSNIDGGDGKNYAPPIDRQVIKLDVFNALSTIPDNSVSFITSEQFFEHFSRQDGYKLMTECHRVLKPGGVMRIQVPDLYITVKLYLDEVPLAPWKNVQYPHRIRHIESTNDPYGKLIPGEEYLPSMMLNNGFHMDGHKYLYDNQTLVQSLKLSGFSNIYRCNFGESSFSELQGIDKHDGGETGRHWIPDIALIVEAIK